MTAEQKERVEEIRRLLSCRQYGDPSPFLLSIIDAQEAEIERLKRRQVPQPLKGQP